MYNTFVYWQRINAKNLIFLNDNNIPFEPQTLYPAHHLQPIIGSVKCTLSIADYNEYMEWHSYFTPDDWYIYKDRILECTFWW
jgi:hypothetical protein